MASETSEPRAARPLDAYVTAKGSKFKFKSRSHKRRRSEDDEGDEHRSSRRHRSDGEDGEKHRPSRHRRRKGAKPKYHEDLKDNPAAYDDTYAEEPIDPDRAFRESLFDALADDEGAQFWEGVYGQPIHTYPNQKEGEQGHLEQMTEEEYAEYVRSKMWEKTHQHVMEERERREERRRRRKEEEDRNEEEFEKAERERKKFEAKISASLRRGEERKERKRWSDAWQRYLDGWDKFKNATTNQSSNSEALAGKAARGIIPWPVESGKWKDADKEDVENFFRNAIPTSDDMTTLMKAERVRWHPDKMQQRFGANKMDEETMRTVTAVFQVIDRLWGDFKGRK